MTTPWPLHPPPVAGEAFSSWIGRIGARLRADVPTLLGDLGYRLDHPDDLDQLDVAIPRELARQVAERTRVPAPRIRAMSLAGRRPALTSASTRRGRFTAYTRRHSILLPPGRRRDRSLPGWRPWISTTDPLTWRVCPACLPGGASLPRSYPLIWAVPILLTCPIHHHRLEPYGPRPGLYRHRPTATGPSPPVDRAARMMDAHTQQGLTTGHVTLPGGRVTAVVWLRLLRTLLDELSATLPEAGTARPVLEQAWDLAGQPVRAGQHGWRAFEQQPATAQEQTLRAAATTLRAIDDGALTPRGQTTGLFRPPRDHPLVSPRGHRQAVQQRRPRGSRLARSSPARDAAAGRAATTIVRQAGRCVIYRETVHTKMRQNRPTSAGSPARAQAGPEIQCKRLLKTTLTLTTVCPIMSIIEVKIRPPCPDRPLPRD